MAQQPPSSSSPHNSAINSITIDPTAQQPPSSHLRHQSSLESIINFQVESPMDSDLRDKARRRFYDMADYFENNPNGSNSNSDSRAPSYNRARLIRLTHDYARSALSQDNFLRVFFKFIELSMDSDETLYEPIRAKFDGFADYLFDNFFMPVKASALKTPQPSPAVQSAVARFQREAAEFVGTPQRISALRGACLARDRYRCVVTRSFDDKEANQRHKVAGDAACDDDGKPLMQDEVPTEALEVAHILPHSLTSLGGREELSQSKQNALAILDMFDRGVRHLIEGVKIDRPTNAITLTPRAHRLFGNFDIFFEPVEDAEPHTYQIRSFRRPYMVRGIAPVQRTLYLTESRTIDPPSPRLLAIHRAIAHILHLSAAGEYIDKILEDMENGGQHVAEADGSTDLGHLVSLGLWLGGIPTYAY